MTNTSHKLFLKEQECLHLSTTKVIGLSNDYVHVRNLVTLMSLFICKTAEKTQGIVQIWGVFRHLLMSVFYLNKDRCIKQKNESVSSCYDMEFQFAKKV